MTTADQQGNAPVIEMLGDLPVVCRRVVRMLVLDERDRLLLFHTRDLDHPAFGTWWELPGGGIDPGESLAAAAVRELAEETGVAVGPARVGPPLWRRRASFKHRDGRRVQDEAVVTVRLPGPGPDVDETGRFDYEREAYFGFRWWPVSEVTGSRQRFYPGLLPVLLPALLAGEPVDQPFELWS